jgi:hypothetical protein
MDAITAAEKLAEISREVKMRKRVYPGMIVNGALSEALAAKRIAIMQSIENDYRLEVDQMKLPL